MSESDLIPNVAVPEFPCNRICAHLSVYASDRGKMVFPIESLFDNWPEERTYVLLAPSNY